MTITIAYAAAIISSASFGIASVAEQKATKEIGSLSGLNLKNFITLGRKPYYIAGLLLDGVGYGTFIVAVRALPLFFVQAVGTASILITALAARLFLHAKLSRQAYLYIMLILFGLLLLSFATGPADATTPSVIVQRLFLLFAGLLALSSVVARKAASNHPVVAATMSGLCFSAVAVLTRILQVPHHWWMLIASPVVMVIAANGVLGLMLFSVALQQGSAAIVYGINFVVETIVPTLLGLSLLGDSPLHHRWDLLIIGLITMLIGTLLLAGQRQRVSYA